MAKDGEQAMLIDTDHPAHAKLKRLAKAYLSKREDWSAARIPVTEAKQRLIDAMNEEKLDHFKIADLEIILKHGKESVKVRLADEDDEEEEAEEGE